MLAIKRMPLIGEEEIRTLNFLALEAAKQGDFQALDYLIGLYDAISMHHYFALEDQELPDLPPFLACTALSSSRLSSPKTETLSRANKDFDQAIEGYDKARQTIPVHFLAGAAELKQRLGDDIGADKLFTRLISMNGHSGLLLPSTYFMLAILSKLKLKDDKGVGDLQTQTLSLRENFPKQELCDFATFYCKLNQYKLAEEFIDHAIGKFGYELHPDFLQLVIALKTKLGKHDEVSALIIPNSKMAMP